MKWEEFQPVFRTLAEAFAALGHQLHLVGGCVRDHLLGLEPKDFDFATSARPEATKAILEHLPIVTTTYPIGERFGTIAAKLANGQQIEITTFRRDITPGRHPDVMFATDLATDLERRDFAFNSMACNPDGIVIDPFGGRRDLADRRIACTGDAYARFSEDPLRMLRAARFVSKLGFSLDPKAAQAMRRLGNSILSVSRERWLEEMDKLLVGSHAGDALQSLAHTGLLWFVLPEMLVLWRDSQEGVKGVKDIWAHTKAVVGKVSPRPDLRWAALLHDVGKPQTIRKSNGRIHFLGHETLGSEMADGIARRFKMANDRRRAIRGLVFLHQRVRDTLNQESEGGRAASMRVLRRLVRECGERSCAIEDLIDLFGADCSSSRESKRNLVAAQHKALMDALARMREEDLRPRLPSGIGNAIMERFGLEPGLEVGEIKRRLYDMLVSGEIHADDSVESMLIKIEGRI